MPLFKLGQLALPSLVLAATIQALPQSVRAASFPSESEGRIVINDPAGAGTAQALGAPFTAVTQINFFGSPGCSGALISPNTVITAKHCTDGVAPGNITVDFFDNTNSLAFTETVMSKIEILPVPQVSLLDGTDVSLLMLNNDVTTIDPLRFFTGDPTGMQATTVGFGWNGVGSVGHGFGADGLRWAAENVIDSFGQAVNSAGAIAGTANILNTDFDDGSALNNTLSIIGSSAVPLVNEGTTAPGDSGGPLLVNRNGEYLIAGVLSGGTTATSQYGDISWWTGTELYREEIQAKGGEFVDPEPVPEPSPTLALMTVGAIATGISWYRRRQHNNY